MYRKINLTLSLTQLVVAIFVIIPLIRDIISGYRGIGYGIVVIYAAIPTLYGVVFSGFAFFNCKKHFIRVKRILILAYILGAVICVIPVLLVPYLPFSLAGIPLFIALALKIREKNIYTRLIITQLLVLVMQAALIFWVPR